MTESGYAETIESRPKVGAAQGVAAFTVVDLARDTSYVVRLRSLPGADEAPAYRVALDSAAADSARLFTAWGPVWSPDGRWAVLDVRSQDNKDRWIARLDAATGTLETLDRQHDDAWIGGPGISWWGGESALGWIPSGQGWRLWFQSERTGWSHLYAADPATGRTEALTSGAFEVADPQFSRDARTVVFQSSEGDLAQRHVWRMPVGSFARRERLTAGVGRWDALVAPDDAARRLPLVDRQHAAGGERRAPGRAPRPRHREPVADVPRPRVARARDHPDPGLRRRARPGAHLPPRRRRCDAERGGRGLRPRCGLPPERTPRGGARTTASTSSTTCSREQGYVVLDPDYRASEGYGRDWRTAVYRHAGGRDLQDVVDASRYVGTEFGIDPERVAVYGGSYGGFITLMALFTEADHFGGGAALRAVTDWAHYNDGYTRNILNAPADDSLAYARSSPIEFAAGLDDPLLMAHGLVDDNVQPQDIFRLVAAPHRARQDGLGAGHLPGRGPRLPRADVVDGRVPPRAGPHRDQRRPTSR